jgi:hypothetical protein
MLAVSSTGIENLATVSSETRDVYAYADDALRNNSREPDTNCKFQDRKAERELTIRLIIDVIRGVGIRPPYAEVAIDLL